MLTADFVDGFLTNFPEEIQKVSRKLRDTVRHEMKNAEEFLYYNAINYSLSSSPLDRVCYIRPLQRRVTLGLLFGRQLDDPKQLLRGIGKRSRYVVVRTEDEAKNSGLKDLVKAAWANGPASVAELRQLVRVHRAELRRHRKQNHTNHRRRAQTRKLRH